MPFVVIAILILLVVLWYLREGRNEALEGLLTQTEFGPATAFHGSLAVEEHQPGVFLQLGKSSSEARWLQIKYRWLVGMGRQAIFDRVKFDGSRRLVELKKKNKLTVLAFSDFSSVRMREVAGKNLVSYWHVELVPQRGRAIPFVTSRISDRQTCFSETALVAKAVSQIMAIPAQVFVAGNVWTPGWPPKISTVSKDRSG